MSDQAIDYLEQAVNLMMSFIRWPERKCVIAIYRFAEKLPPEEVLEAVEITMDKLPNGGEGAFLYFCATCHGKIRDQRAWDAWNSR